MKTASPSQNARTMAAGETPWRLEMALLAALSAQFLLLPRDVRNWILMKSTRPEERWTANHTTEPG